MLRFIIIFFFLFLLLVQQGVALSRPLTSRSSSRNKQTTLHSGRYIRSASGLVAQGAGGHVVAASAPKAVAAGVAKTAAVNDVVARLFGYLLGAGSMLVYTPIIVSLLKAKSSDGYSVQTWIFNLLGLAVALIYPFKRAFPLSTYIEIVILTVQSAGILGLICTYGSLTKEYLLGMTGFALLAAGVAVTNINAKTLQALQLLAIVICNYANIPQILLTFKTKQAKWSPITAAMSMAGNAIRIFTTLQLTQDTLVMSGNVLGLVTNAILLAQVYFYRAK